MSLKLEADLKSFQDIDKVLEKLGDRVTRNASSSALKAAGKVIINDVKSNLPGEYKSLKKSMFTKVLRAKDKFNRVAVVGPRDNKQKTHNPGIYGIMLEYGTLGSRSYPLARKTKRKKHTSPLPTGLKPVPFLRPAVDKTKSAQLRAMVDQLRAYLTKRGFI